MTDHSSAFRECLEKLDVNGMRKLWAHVAPHLPQPKGDEEVLISLHHARTQANSIAIKLRAYSHAWLRERNLPSGLPDQLRASAERMYPIISKAVGISVNFSGEWLKPVASEVRTAMENAVHEAFAEGKQDDQAFIRTRMDEARNRTMLQLMGRFTAR